MPDVPVPASPDTPAEIQTVVPAPLAEILPPTANLLPAIPEERPPTDVPPVPGVPWWFWPLGFLVVFGVDAALVLALVAQQQNLAVAAGVPGALTLVSLGVLRALAGHMGRRG
ncbi:hypothetical protein [Amycolatopsis sp. cmx-4-61]|uniref:hypothetical protein n=1 Tax=Amycolatopsis sp. cmx-4-61 TaxID=2790937 RepID=UPI003978EC44